MFTLDSATLPDQSCLPWLPSGISIIRRSVGRDARPAARSKESIVGHSSFESRPCHPSHASAKLLDSVCAPH